MLRARARESDLGGALVVGVSFLGLSSLLRLGSLRGTQSLQGVEPRLGTVSLDGMGSFLAAASLVGVELLLGVPSTTQRLMSADFCGGLSGAERCLVAAISVLRVLSAFV